ncbi:hypothetical protein BST28156_05421 [Burkholderia stagnalis]|nr:hypothetical protein BST28156_05421 [Burkholderia stagnalis]
MRKSTLFGFASAWLGTDAPAPYAPDEPLKVHQQMLPLPLPENGVIACPFSTDVGPSPVSAMFVAWRA